MTDIHWPAILQYDNDPELEYLGNAAAWKQAMASSENVFEQHDRLIDSEGQVFSCEQLAREPAGLMEPAEKLSLETVLGLVKAHLADAGSCCVAKAYAPSIREAIRMLQQNECGID